MQYRESRYDWRRFETELNSFQHFRTLIDGLGIHFIHAQSPHADALPIILTHGWPGSIAGSSISFGPLLTRQITVVAYRMRSMLSFRRFQDLDFLTSQPKPAGTCPASPSHGVN